MILISVGTQFPFDRMVRTVDKWAQDKPDIEFYAQVGPSSYSANSFESFPFSDYDSFSMAFNNAKLIISHAGMGNIIRALEAGKPIVILPRLSSFGEHRNDHQVGTAKAFSERPGVYLAEDENQLFMVLDRAWSDVETGVEYEKSTLDASHLLDFLRTSIS